MKIRNLTTGIAAFAATTALTAGVAFAQDNSFIQGDSTVSIDAEDNVIKDADLEKTVKSNVSREPGWYPTLHIGGSAQANYNHHVDGVTEGTAFTFGLEIKAGIDGIFDVSAGKLEWTNGLDIEHQQTKAPNLNHFQKSKDNFDFNTMLRYRDNDLDWIGPFVRFRMQTSLFPGYYTNDSDTMIRYYRSGSDSDNKVSDENALDDGMLIGADLANNVRGKTTAMKAQDQVKLAESGNPLKLSESIGAFIDPYQSDPFTVSFRVGVAGQHQIITNGDNYASWDSDDDDKITVDGVEYEIYDVIELEDVNSVGIEGIVEMKGIAIDMINWNVFASIYYPFAGDWDKDVYEGADLIHSEIGGKVSFKFSDWGSLDWTIDAKRDPFVTLKWQFNTNVLLSIGFDIFKS